MKNSFVQRIYVSLNRCTLYYPPYISKVKHRTANRHTNSTTRILQHDKYYNERLTTLLHSNRL